MVYSPAVARLQFPPTMLALATLLAAAHGGPAAAAQTVVTPADRVDLGLTVYSSFAQVRDARRASIPGETTVVWTGVPETLDPGTLVVTADGQPLAIDAYTFAPTVYGENAVLAQHIGETVILVSPDGERISATLVSADGPVFRADGRLIIGWKGHVEIPIPAPTTETPADPAVRFRLDGSGGANTLTVSYLADGVSWDADYIAILDEDGDSPMRFSGGATIANGTGFAFPDATLQLVAGDVRRGGGPPIPFVAQRMSEMAVAQDTGFERAPLGDYHVYTLDRPATIGALETVQVPLFAPRDIPVERDYVLTGQRYWFQGHYPDPAPVEHPEIRLTFHNSGDEPIPAGTLHSYVRDDDGRLQFTGDAQIAHTPAEERIVAVIGSAFDLVAERIQTDYRALDERTHETAWRIEIRNRGDDDRTVTVLEPLAGEWTILEESYPHERLDAQTVRWRIPVPAGGEAVLTYRVRTTT